VDSEAFKSAAQKVDRSVSDLNVNIEKFANVIEGLNSSWSSDVKNKFFQSYEKDIAALHEMIAQYSEVAEGLRALAEYHEKNEEAVRARIEKAGKAYG